MGHRGGSWERREGGKAAARSPFLSTQASVPSAPISHIDTCHPAPVPQKIKQQSFGLGGTSPLWLRTIPAGATTPPSVLYAHLPSLPGPPHTESGQPSETCPWEQPGAASASPALAALVH